MPKYIEASDGTKYLVDDDVYEWASSFKWYNNKGYAQRHIVVDGKKSTVRMHREILSASDGVLVDHISRDRLDNRRENLRLCTHVENARNRSVGRGNTTGLKGVGRQGRYWYARIRVGGARIRLGFFHSKEDAYSAYVDAARKYHGDFSAV
jgi:hypothetical protein